MTFFQVLLSTIFYKKSGSFSKCLVCVCVLFIYTIFISVICVSQEERRLIAFNVQIYDFYKWVISTKKKHWKVNFWYQWIIQCNTDSCCEHIAHGVNIYLYGCVSLSVWLCCVSLCVCVCVILNQSTSKKPRYVSDFSKTPCCIEHVSSSFWF